MKYVDEYRDANAAEYFRKAIHETVTRPWTLMEVCGGQTHAIVKFGIDELLPKEVELVHGPGCPVCVTPLELIDKAIERLSSCECESDAGCFRCIANPPIIDDPSGEFGDPLVSSEIRKTA